jgi:predicted site-specific integrase-resolvase
MRIALSFGHSRRLLTAILDCFKKILAKETEMATQNEQLIAAVAAITQANAAASARVSAKLDALQAQITALQSNQAPDITQQLTDLQTAINEANKIAT